MIPSSWPQLGSQTQCYRLVTSRAPCAARLSTRTLLCRLMSGAATPPGGAPPGPARRTHLSFCGCGFLGIYHLGVAKCLAQHGPAFLGDVQRFGGASAGALVAAALAVRGRDIETLDKCLELCRLLARTVHHRRLGVLSPRLCLLTPIQDFLREMLPDNAYITASGNLFVAMTRAVGMKCVIVSEFDSNEHLIQCLVASSYVPFITGRKAVKIKGQRYIDGGACENLPVIPGARTVMVSPFSGQQHICPRETWFGRTKYVTFNNQNFLFHPNNLIRSLHAFFPPKEALLDEYYQKGQRDAAAFLRRENLYQDQPAPPLSPPSSQPTDHLPSTDRPLSAADLTVIQRETTV